MIKKNKSLFFSLILLLIFFFSTSGISLEIGEYKNPVDAFQPKNLLRTPIGTRAAGLAAFTGNPDDLSAVFFNPAGLSKSNYWELQLSHRDALDKVDFDSIATNIPFSRGSVALYGVLAHVYDYTDTFYGAPDNPYRAYRGGYAGLAVGFGIFDNLFAFGAGAKWISVDASALYKGVSTDIAYNGLLVDLGFQFNYDLSKLRKFLSIFYYLPKLSASIAVMNIHPKTGGEKDFESQTGSLNFGVSLHYTQTFALNLDIINPLDIDQDKKSIRMGIEFWPAFFLALRGGVTTEYDYHYLTYYTGFGIGNILSERHLSLEYTFDTAMYKKNQIESHHQFAIVLSFGGLRYQEKIKDDKPYQMHELQR
jgi:hypothetical protein